MDLILDSLLRTVVGILLVMLIAWGLMLAWDALGYWLGVVVVFLGIWFLVYVSMREKRKLR